MEKMKKAPAQNRHHTHSYLNTISNICLLLLIVFAILVFVGTITDNSLVTVLGLGFGAAGGLIEARINTKEE